MKANPVANNALTFPSAGQTLANGLSIQNTPVNQTTDLAIDSVLQLVITLGSGTLGSNPAVYVYFAGSNDNTHWPGGLSASPGASFTAATVPNFRQIGIINFAAASTTEELTLSLAAAIGTLPNYWSIVVTNATGLAFTALSANYEVWQTQ